MIERETRRLRLRQWQASDFEAYARYYARAETARFVGGVADRDQAWRRSAAEIGHWRLRGLGHWLVPEMHGRGYATEAGAEARDYALGVLKASSLVSYIHPEKRPSKRVAQRLGAHFEEVAELFPHGPHCVFRYAVPGHR